MSKVTLFGNEAREKLKKGIDLIANSIKVTLGPKGRYVIHGFHYGYPIATKDGVTVARNVEALDPVEQLGLLLIRQVAQKTADDAGDGTTTASLLAQAIFTEGLKVLGTNANPILIKRGIDLAVKEALSYILKQVQEKTSKDDILKIAMISANNDPAVGEIVCEAIEKVGESGVITIEDNYSGSDTYIQTIEGMQLNEGYLSPYFVTDRNRMEATYKDAYILMADYEIGHIQALMRPIEMIIGQEKKPLIIIANNVTGTALSDLVANVIKQGLPILVCKAPYFGDNRTEQLTDLAVLTGGRVVGNSSGLKFEDMEITDFGKADTVFSTKSFTTITGGKGYAKDIDARIAVLQATIDKSESDYEREKLQERLAKLTSGVAVIKVGASSEVEVKEKKMRVEDSLCAVRSSLEEGILPGGGLMMLRASAYLKSIDMPETEEEKIGWRIVINALREPIKQIASNAGLDGSEIIAGVLMNETNINWGFNFLTNEYGDMLKMGVIDPAKVIRLTLENAASVSGMLLSCECVIAETREDEITRTPVGR